MGGKAVPYNGGSTEIKSHLDFLMAERDCRKLLEILIQGASRVRGDRNREQCRGGEGRSQSEAALTVCGGYSLWYD